MPDPILGPYSYVETADGEQAPWYIMPFDKGGRCQAPRTRADLMSAIGREPFSDIYIFSHGWNNDWDTATDRYRHFMGGFTKMREDHRLDVRPDYKPLLIGIIWPSTALVMPWEAQPKFAGGAPVAAAADAGSAEERLMIDELAAELRGGDVDRFYALMDEPDGLDERQSLELAQLLLSLGDDQEVDDAEALESSDLVAAWREAQAAFPSETPPETDFDDADFGTVDGAAVAPDAAGLFDRLDPRKLIRLATVLQMKDRAGVVGARGVAPLLRDVLRASASRVHLIGHSYGAKVVLSAVSVAPLPRDVASVLLLQPAVSRFCFAADVGGGRPGGFRVALERTELPIMSTFSRKDAPLTKFFHLAARRGSDVGEVRVAGGEQSRYGALGGFGPGGLDATEVAVVAMKPIGETYGLDHEMAEVLALQGHEAIGGHGSISNDYTWWALYDSIASA
jgi:hypothetical protein